MHIPSSSGAHIELQAPSEPPVAHQAAASITRPFLALSFLSAALLLTQGVLLLPLVQTDPMFQDLPGEVSLERTFWFLRLVAMGATPLVLGLRILSLTTVLHTLLASFGRRGKWKHLLYRVLQAEAIFLLESLCVTLLLGWHTPGDLQAADAIRLRAGLDLLWHPASRETAALLAAANVFSLWWAARLRAAIDELYAPGAWVTAGVVGGAWLLLISMRALLFLG